MGKTFNTGRLGNGLFVDASGNVGIGTTTPNDLLEVSGGFIRLSATAGNGPQFNIYSNGQTNNHVTLAQGFALATDNIGYLYNRANAAFVFGTNNAERLRITSAGNVGIGTNSPSGLLTLAKNNNIAINTSDGSDDGYLAICGAGGDGSTRGGHIYLSGNERGADAGSAILSAGNVSGAFVGFRTGADIERMRITSSGAVGIGTTNPRSFLDVSGATPYIRLTDTAATGENGFIMDATGGFIRGGLTINYATGEFKSFCGVAGNAYFQTFNVNGSERMRILSNGRVAINHNATDGEYLYINTKTTTAYNPNSWNGANAQIGLTNGSGSNGAFSGIRFAGGGATEGFFGIVQNGTLAEFVWQNYNGSSYGERLRITTGGNLRFSNVPSDNYQIDSSIAISIANGGTIPFPNFSGLVIVNNMTNGVCAMWLCGAGYTSLIGQSTGGATGTLSYTGGNGGYTWTSNYGSTANYGVFAVRTRPTA